MARAKKKAKTQMDFDPLEFKDEYLSRFLKDGEGAVKGETIDLEGDDLVLKNGDDFFRIPISSVTLSDNSLMVTEVIDWERAREMGERWRKVELDPL
ncbi:MAG: hypothetical protein JXA22_09395 [Candidatus Thermoplasmatota archaeon]|nr:hypothetical protein [Candidatus Thermoplasmatota archaeon]